MGIHFQHYGLIFQLRIYCLGPGQYLSWQWRNRSCRSSDNFRTKRHNGIYSFDPPYSIESRVQCTYIPRVNRACCCCCCGTIVLIWVLVHAMVCVRVWAYFSEFSSERGFWLLLLVSCAMPMYRCTYFVVAVRCCRSFFFSFYLFFFSLVHPLHCIFSLCAHRCVCLCMCVYAMSAGHIRRLLWV